MSSTMSGSMGWPPPPPPPPSPPTPDDNYLSQPPLEMPASEPEPAPSPEDEVSISFPNDDEMSIDEPCIPCMEKEQEEEEVCEPPPTVRIRVSLFFDGTGNNRSNVEAGEEHVGKEGYMLARYGSYRAGLSNIAKLASAGIDGHGPDVDIHLPPIYIEGIGTTDGCADNRWGSGIGTGATGIPAKVAKGLAAAVDEVASAAAGREVSQLYLDTLGFSRGASAARNAVHQALQGGDESLQAQLSARGCQVGRVEAWFVGLFDSVAAFGSLHYGNDTAELQLDAVRHARRVVHLAAGEEHRANYCLTNIDSAGASGLELFLPGVHSDVGGGYADGSQETELVLVNLGSGSSAEALQFLERERRWLIDTGWYLPEELHLDLTNLRLIASRSGLSNAFANIPLALMAEHARAQDLRISAMLEVEHAVPAALQQAEREIRRYCAAKQAPGPGAASGPSDWFAGGESVSLPWLNAIRHDFLHFSAHYLDVGEDYIGQYPEWTSDTMDGRRTRTVYPG